MSSKTEGSKIPGLSWLLFRLYGIKKRAVRTFIRKLVLHLEGDSYTSVTIRRIFAHYHGVTVDMHSGPGCFVPWHFRKGTTVGRYTTIYQTAQAFSANHPSNTKSTHAYFYNPLQGYVKNDYLYRNTLTIGSDVFIGHNAIILPGVQSIGDGAIVGAGAVVNKDVPPFAIVSGNPARVVRYRFSKEKIQELIESRWWEKSLDELTKDLDSFGVALDGSDTIY